MHGLAKQALSYLVIFSKLSASLRIPSGNLSDAEVEVLKPRATVEDTFTPDKHPVRVQIMGDSYTAGPGAGRLVETSRYTRHCKQFSNSYGLDLFQDWPFYNRRHHNNGVLACTGDKTGDFLKRQIPKMKRDNDVVALTLGGNDIGFLRIIRACLLNLSVLTSCDKAIKDSEKKIDSLHGDMFKVWKAIFKKMPDNWHMQVYHLGYPRFFNAQEDWCDSEHFQIPLHEGAKLTKHRRRQLNELVRKLNTKLNDMVTSFNEKHHNKGSLRWGHKRLFFMDPDVGFEGHRFCEKGMSTFHDDKVYLFGVSSHDVEPRAIGAFNASATNDTDELSGPHYDHLNAIDCPNDARYSTDDDFNLLCDYAQVTNSTKDVDAVVQAHVHGLVTRSFHPRSTGMRVMKRALAVKLKQQRDNRAYPVTNGFCSFHFIEEATCSGNGNSHRVLHGDLAPLFDHVKLNIGGMEGPAMIEETYVMGSRQNRLPDPIYITGHKEGGGYVDFNYKAKHWNTRGAEFPPNNRNGWCSVGGWAPATGSGCGRKAVRNMDCTFHCN